MRKLRISIIALAGIAAISATVFVACNGNDRPGGATVIEIPPNTCPLPEFLPKEDIDRMKTFGAEVAGIQDKVGSASFNVDLTNKVNREYPAAEDANRLFALAWAGCLRCRLAPSDIAGCAKIMDEIVRGLTQERNETDLWDSAEEYFDKLMATLQ